MSSMRWKKPSVEVRSRVGEGTVFTVTLPAVDAKASQAQARLTDSGG